MEGMTTARVVFDSCYVRLYGSGSMASPSGME